MISVTGTGSNKKQAKQRAAEALIVQLLDRGVEFSRIIEEKKKSKASRKKTTVAVAGSTDQADNYVGKLQTLCAGRKLPVPKYETKMEYGDPHEKVFVYQCSVGDLMTTGEGSRKLQAKQNSAATMLEILENL